MRTKNLTRRALAMTAAGAATVVMLAGCTSDEPEVSLDDLMASASATVDASPSASATGSQDAASEYSPEEQAAIEEAKAAVLKFQGVVDTAFADPGNAGDGPFDDVAIDPVRSTYNSLVAADAQDGLRLTGKHVVTFEQVKSVKTRSDPEKFVYPKVVFDVCLDGSATDLLDKSGKNIEGDSPRNAGTVGVYEEPGQGWFVELWEIGEGGCQS